MNGKLVGLAVLGLIGICGYVKNENLVKSNLESEEAVRAEVREIFAQTAQENTQREIAEQVKAQLQEREARTWTEPAMQSEATDGTDERGSTQIKAEDEAAISVIEMAQKLCAEADAYLAARAEKVLDQAMPVAMTMLPQSGCNCAPRLDAIDKRLAAIEAKFAIPVKGEVAPPVPAKSTPVADAPGSSNAPVKAEPPKLYFNPMTGTYSTEQVAVPVVAPVVTAGAVCENGVCNVAPNVNLTPVASSQQLGAPGSSASYVYNPATGTYDAAVFSSLPATIAVATMEASCESCGPVRRVLGACFPRIAGRIRANRGW